MERQASENRRRGRAAGSLVAGLLLAEFGVLQFVKTQFGIEWPQMWPLLLLVPGLTIAISALVGKSDRRG